MKLCNTHTHSNLHSLDRQSSRQTQLASAFESYPPGDTLFQGRLHTFIPPDDSFRTKVSPRIEYIIPLDTFMGDTLFRGTGSAIIARMPNERFRLLAMSVFDVVLFISANSISLFFLAHVLL